MYIYQILKLLTDKRKENDLLFSCYVLVDLGNTSTLFFIPVDDMLLKMADYDTDMFVNAYVSDNSLIVG